MATSEDWRDLAAKKSRDDFAAAYPYPFLLALSGLDANQQPARTVRMQGGPELMAAIMAERRRLMTASQGPTVLPIRKVQSTFPRMITVGRAKNNDIVIGDALVSKFHAFFKQLDDGSWGVADAGSANGTKLGEKLLPSKGEPVSVRDGDKVTFGVSAFRFVSAAGLWAALRPGGI